MLLKRRVNETTENYPPYFQQKLFRKEGGNRVRKHDTCLDSLPTSDLHKKSFNFKIIYFFFFLNLDCIYEIRRKKQKSQEKCLSE